MKIAFLGPAHPFRGGIVHFNSRLAKALQSRPELHVDLFYWSKPYPSFLLRDSAAACLDEQSSLTFHQPGLSVLSYTNPLTWLALISRLRNGRYDMFITHWVHPVHFPVFKVLFGAIRMLTKTKICLIVHNCLPHEHLPGAVFMSRSVLGMANRLVVHGGLEAEQAKRIGLKGQDMIIAFHPIYDQFVMPPESRESIRRSLGLREKVFLFFGFIRPYKGLECLLEAFQNLASRHPDVSLLVVGEHFYQKKGETRGKDRLLSHLPPDDPVRKQIVWIDRYVANEEVGRYFAVADALVAPYLSATQSGPLQVAYACDKPVIASDLPAFRECVCHGESGYLFSTGNARDLTEKMELFLNKPIAAEQVQRYRQRFNWNNYVDMVLHGRNTGME
ncbi:MAG TPA: glycosyltransferase [Thermodesulfobacteriota bacterium]|jgi:glycosyltransferase involved in cell wall biosynthesis|nr:glycosyltransferase [Thermodesulfobacteriota bacterium]